jgi:hypothetical protein
LLLPRSRLLLRALRLPLFPSLLGRPLLLLLDALLLLGLLVPLDLLSWTLLLLPLPLLLGLLSTSLLIALWSTLLLRCAFVLPILRPVGLTLLLLALTVVLGVYGYHRSGKQEDRGRSGYSHF